MPVLPYGPGKSTSAGTVTSVSVVNANGVSATVATPTTTPAITVSLGAITPTSVASTGAVSGTTGTFSGQVTDTGTTLQQIRTETSGDFVSSGCVWTINTGQTGKMTAGIVYVSGVRTTPVAVTSQLFTASQDTYVSVSTTGAVSYSAVANNSNSPGLSAGSVWLAIVVTGTTAITSINQGQIGAVAPIVSGRTLMVSDTNGYLIYPMQNQKILSYAQTTTSFVTASTTDVQVTGLTTTIIIPTNARKVKITAYVPTISNNLTAAWYLTIWEGTVGTGTQFQQATGYMSTTGTGNFAIVTAIINSSFGSHTYNVGTHTSQGTMTQTSSATVPSFISVELL